MTVEQHVKFCIGNYPNSYAISKDFNECKFFVLQRLFFYSGMGYDWAYTKNPENGGYLIEPQYKPTKDDYKRKIDPDYGTNIIKTEYDVDKLLSDTMYRIIDMKNQDTITSAKPNYKYESELNLKEINWFPKNLVSSIKNNEECKYGMLSNGNMISQVTHTHSKPVIEIFSNFNKKDSFFWKKEVKYIQKDWKEEALFQLNYWLNFFSDETLILPKDMAYGFNLKRSIKFFNETIDKFTNNFI